MDLNSKTAPSRPPKSASSAKGENGGLFLPHDGENVLEREEDGELKSLLSPKRQGPPEKGLNRRLNSNRKVQWNDFNGNKLVEVWEFEPSPQLGVCYDLHLQFF
ncbi:hypothetical protein AMTR_s00067p00201450 [Amborella trichopoda]|uniref:Uncharacterized protein n=1 Tax=Amborella trichopoda TaxID=13333 RepID=U5DBY7_AMBTC|nr:hypothetical protein AMTR_s00067p00201450 [Amborella trichopoda]